MICPVPPKLVNPLWPQLEPLIASALQKVQNDCYLPRDIWRACREGQMIAWIDWVDESRVRAVAVTEIHNLPQKRICNIPFVAGTQIKEWLPGMLDAIEKYAREIGCDRMTGGGRKGWIRAAGFKEWALVVMKDISDG